MSLVLLPLLLLFLLYLKLLPKTCGHVTLLSWELFCAIERMPNVWFKYDMAKMVQDIWLKVRDCVTINTGDFTIRGWV